MLHYLLLFIIGYWTLIISIVICWEKTILINLTQTKLLKPLKIFTLKKLCIFINCFSNEYKYYPKEVFVVFSSLLYTVLSPIYREVHTHMHQL